MAGFICSACKKKCGDRRVGVAWIRDGQKERSMRLCKDCGIKAEKERTTDDGHDSFAELG